jgi:phytanoyl-CoA hydroxylase
MSTKKSLSFFTDEEKVLEFYHQFGFHIEENVFTDAECAQLIEASKHLDNAKNGTHRPSMMPHRTDDIFLAAMRKPALTKIISTLVGGAASGIQSEFFYCKPGTRGFSMHQDNFYVEAKQGVFASAWTALTDTYAEKGGLIVYPGTHKEGDLPVRKLTLPPDASQDPNANNEETVVPPQYKALNVQVPKGAALFIHGHLVHASNPNTSNEWRYVILNTYIKKGEPFRAGRYAQRAEVDLLLDTQQS